MPTSSEFVCPDGYVLTKTPLSSIRFLDPKAVKVAAAGDEAKRYAAYLDVLAMGHSVNGAVIVYRAPNGNLFASDVRHSEIVVHAMRNVKYHPLIDKHVVDPHVSVKVIDVKNRDDIPAQRAAYLEANR